MLPFDIENKREGERERVMQAAGIKLGASALSRAQLQVAAGRKANRLVSNSRSRSAAVVVRAEDEDVKGTMADIGLGDLEDVMEKASGGSTTPDFVPEDLEGVFKLLGSEDVDLAQTLLVEKFGENLYRELGFTKQTETINGRLAMIGFLAGFGALFTGDILTQFANAPRTTIIVTLAIITASVIPTVKPEGYVPDAVKGGVEKVFNDFGLSDIFTTKAEMINGRAAMIGIFALTLLSVIF